MSITTRSECEEVVSPNFRVILTKDNVIFENKEYETMWIGQKNCPIVMNENDPILRLVAKKMGVEVFEIMACFDQCARFFEE